MDFIANRIQPKIAGLSYVVIQSQFFRNKVDSNGGLWRERGEERALIGNISYSHAFSLNI